MKDWSNLAKIVFKRTYARDDLGTGKEAWPDTIDRVLAGNFRMVADTSESRKEKAEVREIMLARKAGPAGRGLWFSGAPAHAALGGAALCNCWYLDASKWENFVVSMDLLMLGGGVGMSVEHRFVSKLPRVRKGVVIAHKATKDADFIVPDSRAGWCELLRRTLEAYFVTGRGFTYSTLCVRAQNEPIKGFGGRSSGPGPLTDFIANLSRVLGAREGRTVRPIDAMDITCATGEMVVSGNVRRSAIIILGDPWDKDYLKSKRWDLGSIPTYRAFANISVICDDPEDLHPLYWKSYEHGEAIGIVNRTNLQRFGRMGELRRDTAEGVNPCGEAALEPFEPCNLQEIALGNISSPAEFLKVARLMHRYGKRVTLERYHHEASQQVVERNRRVGTGITGCLQSSLYTPGVLDDAYAAIQDENTAYSRALGIAPSIRTTLVKPSGTMSKLLDQRGEGIHAAWSRYQIQRVRFAGNDPLLPILRASGHPMEGAKRFDGTTSHSTQVVDFYLEAPPGLPCADEGYGTWEQLNTLMTAQRHWSDQAVSVTVYYRKEEIPRIRDWLVDNLKNIKTISFLCHNDHGFVQAPKEAITKEQYESLSARISPIDADSISGDEMVAAECEGGVCPVK